MADLFTRLVSGPAATLALAPRVPALHEPIELSNVDDAVEMVPWLTPSPPALRPAPPLESPPFGSALLESPAAESAPEPAPLGPPLSSTPAELPGVAAITPQEEVVRQVEVAPSLTEVVVREVRGEAAPKAVPGDLAGNASLQRQKSSKISPELRPREHETPLPPRSPRSQRSQRSQPGPTEAQEPARTTVRIEIGRIEIRAPQRPQPIPSARNPVPEGLTLADYLRGNDGRPR